MADIVPLRTSSQHRHQHTAAAPATPATASAAVSASAPASAPAAGRVAVRPVPAGPVPGVRPASAVADAGTGLDRLLPVLPELRPLLPGGGLRRGATVAVSTGGQGRTGPMSGLSGIGATSLTLALLAGASRTGSWCAVVGMPTLGAVAAAEVGVDLGRLALVPDPGPDWSTVVAALLDGVDVVVAVFQAGLSVTIARRLAARARQRGSVLVPYGSGWEGADLVLEPVHGVWQGLDAGRGRLRARELTVRARGRGAASRPRQVRVWLPAPGGDVPSAPVRSGPLGVPVAPAGAAATAALAATTVPTTTPAAAPYPDGMAV